MKLYYWGIDLATRENGDSTVITILEGVEHPIVQYQYITRVLKEIRGVDLQEQWEFIKVLAKQYPPVKMKIDQTGLGMQIGQLAVREFKESIAEGIHMTQLIKDAIISNFRSFLEIARNNPDHIKKLVLPNNPTLINEVLSLEREISLTNVPKYHHPDVPNAHDDYVWSVALACWGAHEAEGHTVMWGNLLDKPSITKEIEDSQREFSGHAPVL